MTARFEPDDDRPSAEDIRFRDLLSEALSGSDRTNLASQLSIRTGRRISLAMLNAYATRSNNSAKFPAFLVPLLCEILGDDRLQKFLMGPRLRKLLEFAERELAASREQRDREALREKLMNGTVHGPPENARPKP